jgi:PAS domain-containing protein
MTRKPTYEELEQRIKELEQESAKRKRAEEALRTSQVLLNETRRMAKVGGWEFDIDTQEQVWTEAVYHIHEVDPTYRPTVSKGIAFYAPTSRPIIERAIRRAIEYGEPFDVELEFITAKGNLRWVHAIGNGGGTTRSSDEVCVMQMERRGCAVRF